MLNRYCFKSIQLLKLDTISITYIKLHCSNNYFNKLRDVIISYKQLVFIEKITRSHLSIFNDQF